MRSKVITRKGKVKIGTEINKIENGQIIKKMKLKTGSWKISIKLIHL